MTPATEDFVKYLLEHMGDCFYGGRQDQSPSLRKDLFPYTHLFSPIQINRLHVKNRIVMGPIRPTRYGR